MFNFDKYCDSLTKIFENNNYLNGKAKEIIRKIKEEKTNFVELANKISEKKLVKFSVTFSDIDKCINGDYSIKSSFTKKYLEFNRYNIITLLEENTLSYAKEEYGNYVEVLKIFSYYIKPNQAKTSGVSSSQIRQVFNKIKKIKSIVEKKKSKDFQDEKNELVRIKLEIHYIIGKNQKNIELKYFLEILAKLIDKVSVTNKEDFIRLFEFLEGVICYLKYFGDNE